MQVLGKPCCSQEPNCYEARLSLGLTDGVTRSFAHRSLSVRDGRLLLNGKVVFVHGVLYQGYWPESLLTPPDMEAMQRDLQLIKAVGFNTIRVHAVVMGEAFYAMCDKIGLLVFQDMPAGDMRAMPVWSDDRAMAEEELNVSLPQTLFNEIRRSPASQAAFETELQAMVNSLSHFASIAVWVLFNEGWGQSNTKALVELLRNLDPHRLIDASSGWNELGGHALGDLADIHNYEDNSSIFGPLAMSFESFAYWGYSLAGRIPALGEYGGVGYAVDGHCWSSRTWGYGEKRVKQSRDVYASALEKLLLRLVESICTGLGAAIYTQWNDVETEVNGLLTYDRHLKLPMEFYQRFSHLVQEAARKCTLVPDGKQHIG
ncbi:lacZ [Symbiodinium pilosum]|uniref:LacZ protein n=1 Tax=Symbiodinium pilosum TaxID=2952 RepID=A0A812ML97_SYMPI|nr:lacZ [Symbiodinium pilosum]